jgi:hypothetical protein
MHMINRVIEHVIESAKEHTFLAVVQSVHGAIAVARIVRNDAIEVGIIE